MLNYFGLGMNRRNIVFKKRKNKKNILEFWNGILLAKLSTQKSLDRKLS